MAALLLENRHTGETMALRRTTVSGEEALEIDGVLPPGRAAMSVHAHRGQDLALSVRTGSLRALLGNRRVTIPEGETLHVPRGTPYRLWNEGMDASEYRATAVPVADLDRYLQGYFQVVNAGERDHPPLTYLARLHLRHRHSQSLRLLSAPFQTALFLGAAAAGALVGRYRGEGWPGAPDTCPGVRGNSGADR